MPFLDMAYQGFADGIDADAVAFNLLQPPACSSLSPARSRRTSRCTASAFGALSSSPPPDESARVMSQVKRVIRTNSPTRRPTVAP